MYHELTTIALLGATLISLALAVKHLPVKAKGATQACRLRVKWHQARRRAFMLRNGGLVVSVGRVEV